jgi:cell volume regulation protein A
VPLAEPLATGVLLLTLGLLVGLSAASSRASGRLGLPAALLFLGIGVLAGGFGAIRFADHGLAFRLGTAALVLILFDGGLNTPFAALRQAVWPSLTLATLGITVTASLTAAGAHLLGFSWEESLLLGAVVCSTDAAAVFSVLRGGGVRLRRRVALVLEMEAGMNDPLAVILTIALTGVLLGVRRSPLGLVGAVALEMGAGCAVGLLAGHGGRALLSGLRLAASGLYPVVTAALAFAAYGLAAILHGSGFVAVYVAALVVGNGPVPYQAGVRRVHDSLAWLAQVAMYLLLGLLVVPSRLPEVAVPAVALGLLLALVARPVAVALCLAPFRFAPRVVAYLGWVGLRGATPIILATFPVLVQAPGAERIFHVVFFVVVANALVPGATVRAATRPPRPPVQGRPAPRRHRGDLLPPPHGRRGPLLLRGAGERRRRVEPPRPAVPAARLGAAGHPRHPPRAGEGRHRAPARRPRPRLLPRRGQALRAPALRARGMTARPGWPRRRFLAPWSG